MPQISIRDLEIPMALVSGFKTTSCVGKIKLV